MKIKLRIVTCVLACLLFASQVWAKECIFERVIDDMTMPHEGRPHGVPSYWRWAKGPVYCPPKPDNFTAMTAWGQIYEELNGSGSTNTRVQLRGVKAYGLKKNGVWVLLQTTDSPIGSAYPENYSGKALPADKRNESSGGYSVKMIKGYNYHFYPDYRAAVDDSIYGVVIVTEARLIVDKPSLPDDRTKARYIMSVGGDWWLDKTAMAKPDWSTCQGIADGRFKYIETYWKTFYATNLSEQELRTIGLPMVR